MVDSKYSKAFTEVIEILKKISREDYEKIPLEIIEIMEDNMDKDYVVCYNPEIPIEEQDFSDEAKIILAIFFRDYWATEEQKKKILLKEKQDEYLEELEKQKEFTDDIFNNSLRKKEYNRNEQSAKNTDLEVTTKKQNFLKKILVKITKLFSRK